MRHMHYCIALQDLNLPALLTVYILEEFNEPLFGDQCTLYDLWQLAVEANTFTNKEINYGNSTIFTLVYTDQSVSSLLFFDICTALL